MKFSKPERIAVLLPCYNEGLSISQVVKSFRHTLPEATVYVYDNNSIDNTPDEARAAGAVVCTEKWPGKGNVVRQMFCLFLIMLNVASWLSRVPAIILAMVFTWLVNRYFVYRVRTACTAGKAFRYASVASVMALANDMIYLVLVTNGMEAGVAVAAATALQTL